MTNSPAPPAAARWDRPLPAAVALIIAFFFVIQGVQLLYPPDYDGAGWLWLLAAAALAGFAFFSQQRREGEPLLPAKPASFVSLRRLGLGFALLLAGLVLALITVVSLARQDNHQQMRWLWSASLALLVAGSALIGALGPVAPIRQSEPVREAAPAGAARAAGRRRVALELLGVAGLLALAFFLRVYRLQQMPPGIFVDETNAALDALRIMEGRPDSPFATGWFETPTMYAFYLVGLFKLLGTSFVALKAASLLPAILTVAALYPLARLMFGIPTAFAATFLLAISRWHITMSRWGWNEVAPLLFMILAVYFVQRATRDRRASDFALGGLFLGLGHYTYLASRLMTLTVVLYLLYRLLFERGFARRAWRGLAIFLVVYLATFGPLLVTYVRNPFSFSNRSQQVSILVDMQEYYLQQRTPAPKIVGQALAAVGLPKEVSLLPLQESALRHVEMFLAFGDRNPRHNLPGAPMVDPITGSLLILALGFALFQTFRPNARRPEDEERQGPGAGGGQRYALLLFWLLISLLGGILTRLDEAPQAYRTLPAIGAAALLAGDAAVRSARVFGSAMVHLGDAKDARWLRALPAGLMALLLVWAGLLNYRLFFDVQARDGRVWQAFSPVETAVATEVAAAMQSSSLYLSPRLYHFSPLRFLTYRSPKSGGGGLDHPAYQLAEPATDLPLSDPFGQDALFILDTYYQDVPEIFTRYYPGAQFELVEGPGGQPLYLSVTVPGAQISALQGLRGRYALTPDRVEEQRYAGAPRFSWPPDLAQQAGGQALAQWTGSLNIPASGAYDFALDGPGQLLVDGSPWQGARFLGKGLHSLTVQQSQPGTDVNLVLSWLPPGQADFEPAPPNVFVVVDPPTQGLRGDYFSGELWEGTPVFSRVDPLLLFGWPEAEPWPAPFSVRWTGELTAPAAGEYRFQLNADDGVRLWLDGELVGESVNPDNVNLVDVQTHLSAGPHDIRIDYFQRGGGKALEFWWQPPGESLRPVPPSALSPAE
ncbi:MAG TPA: PA14 domain-containing protein [Anaerolineae bacterium]|nr:PA14 domain-containing protein [Anaerolineae bacterium]